MPLTIEALRKRYPGYSDDEILTGLQATQYPDYSIGEIKSAIGYKPPKRSLMAVANDTVIEAANAAAGGVSAAAEFVSPGNRFSDFIDENIVQAGEAKQSDAVKDEKQRFQEEVAGAEGIGDELAAVGGYVLRNPLQSTAQAVGSFVGPGAAIKGAQGIARVAGAGERVVSRAGMAGGSAAGAAMAGGDAAQTAYDLVIKAGGTEEQATAAARQASVIPAAVGGAGGMLGAERIFAGGKGFTGNAASRALKTGASEATQEGIEEGVTQFEGQRAAVPYDPSIDPSKGVAAAAGMGAALGGITGAGVSLISPADAQRDDAIRRLSTARNVDEAIAAATDLASPPTSLMAKAKMTAGQENAALSTLEQQAQADLNDIRQAGRLDKTGMPLGPTVPTTGADGSATAIDSPFADRILTVREQLADPRVRDQIRALQPELLREATYYATLADNPQTDLEPNERLPEATRERMLAMAETIIQRATLREIDNAKPLGSRAFTSPGQLAANPDAPRIGLDTAPTGTIRVDGMGRAAPETRADAISTRQAREQRRDQGLTAQTPKGGEPGAGVMVGQGTLTTPERKQRAPQQLSLLELARERTAPQQQQDETPAQPQKPATAPTISDGMGEQDQSLAGLNRQWQEAAAAGDSAKMRELNDRIVALKQRQQIDERAAEAATSPTNDRPQPTKGQIQANNAKLGHDAKTFKGLDLSIENPAGSVRQDKDNDPPKWRTEMRHHYGYIKGTKGHDKDHVDVFAKPGTAEGWAGTVFVVDQRHRDGSFDEHKVMLGFDNEAEARDAYLANYEKGWTGLKAITPMAYDQFKAWVFDPAKTAKEAASSGESSTGVQARVRRMASGQETLQRSEGQALEGLRGARDQDGRGVGEQLRGIPGRNGEEAVTAALAGPDRNQQGVRAGQLPMGDRAAAGGEQALLPSGNGQRRDDDRRGGGAQSRREADDLQAQSPASETSSRDGGDAGAPAEAQGLQDGGAQRNDTQRSRVGQEDRRQSQNAQGEASQEDAAGQGAASLKSRVERARKNSKPAAQQRPAETPAPSQREAAPNNAVAPRSSDSIAKLGRVMQSAGWEIDYVDLDLTGEKPKAEIKVHRGDGRWLWAKVDAQGRASFETFQRESGLGRQKGLKAGARAPLVPQADDTFLGRQKFEGARAMLRGMTNYLVDNATNPVALEDMRAAWAPLLSDGASIQADAPRLENAAAPTKPLKDRVEEKREEPKGLVVMPADEQAVEQAFADMADQANEDERVAELFRPTWRKPSKVKVTQFLTPEQAKKTLEQWKADARKQGKTGKNANRTVLSLFDASGEWSKPWVEAGYNVVRYDLQDGQDIGDFSAEMLLDTHGNDEVWAILAAPPCTDFASSGAQYWKAKDADGRTEASNELVRQVLRTVELFRPAVWAMENPVGRMAKLNKLPEPLLSFQPNVYGDPYTKKTLLWGNFNNNMLVNPVEPTEGSKITEKLSSSAKYERSLTPEGFAYSFFMSNNYETGFDLPNDPPGGRMAQEFHGIKPEEFAAALFGRPPYVGRKNATEQQIRQAIEDDYNDGNLEGVRATLERFSADDRQAAPKADATLKANGREYRVGDDVNVTFPPDKRSPDGYSANGTITAIDGERVTFKPNGGKAVVIGPDRLGTNLTGLLDRKEGVSLKERVESVRAKPDAERDWSNASPDEIGDEIDRLSAESQRLRRLQLTQDGAEREATIRAMDDADREVMRLTQLLPDEDAQAEQDDAEDGPYEPPENWRESMYYARTYAKELGIPYQGEDGYVGKDLAEVVKMVEKKLGIKPARAKRKQAADAAPNLATPPRLADFDGDRAAYLQARLLWQLEPRNYGGRRTVDALADNEGEPGQPGKMVPRAEIEAAIDELVADGRIKFSRGAYVLTERGLAGQSERPAAKGVSDADAAAEVPNKQAGREGVELRKRLSVLTSLLECLKS